MSRLAQPRRPAAPPSSAAHASQLTAAAHPALAAARPRKHGRLSFTTAVPLGDTRSRCCPAGDYGRRDTCFITHGDESVCAKFIEAHNACLRSEGFDVSVLPSPLSPSPPPSSLIRARCPALRCPGRGATSDERRATADLIARAKRVTSDGSDLAVGCRGEMSHRTSIRFCNQEATRHGLRESFMRP